MGRNENHPYYKGEERSQNPPPEVAHTVRGLDRFTDARRARNVPTMGHDPAEKFHLCDESCILHDHDE